MQRSEILARLAKFDKKVHYQFKVPVLVDSAHIGEINEADEDEYWDKVFAICPEREELYVQELDGDNIRSIYFARCKDNVLNDCLMLMEANLVTEDEVEYKLVHR